jgi:hypothetical protein
VRAHLLSLSLLGNLAPCSAFINLRGDNWRNFKENCVIDRRNIRDLLAIFHLYVVFMCRLVKTTINCWCVTPTESYVNISENTTEDYWPCKNDRVVCVIALEKIIVIVYC